MVTPNLRQAVLQAAESKGSRRPDQALGASYLIRDKAMTRELGLSGNAFAGWPVVFENMDFRVHRIAGGRD